MLLLRAPRARQKLLCRNSRHEGGLDGGENARHLRRDRLVAAYEAGPSPEGRGDDGSVEDDHRRPVRFPGPWAGADSFSRL